MARRGEGRRHGGRRNPFKNTDPRRRAAPKMSEGDQGWEVRVGLKSPIFDPKLAWAVNRQALQRWVKKELDTGPSASN